MNKFKIRFPRLKLFPTRRIKDKRNKLKKKEDKKTTTDVFSSLWSYGVFDQPCQYGCRFGTKTVYCQNIFATAPYLCRRSYFTNGEIQDQDCLAFEPNPNYQAKK